MTISLLTKRYYGVLSLAVMLQNNVENIQIMEQRLHRLEKYLNLEGFLEKSLKIKICLEKYWKITQRY